MRGCFITFEGGEGAGKSTQIQRLQRRLEQAGERVLVTREPGGSEKAEEIRTFILSGRAKSLGPVAEALLFSAARIDHIDTAIRPALDAGTHVLCDRFADSTRAYQGALGKVDARVIRSLERLVVDEVKPDLTLVLDVPVSVGLERARARREAAGTAPDRFEGEDLAFHEALRQAFLDIAATEPERCVVIDATAPPDAVEEAIERAVRERLPRLTGGPGSQAGGQESLSQESLSHESQAAAAEAPKPGSQELRSQEAGIRPADAHVA